MKKFSILLLIAAALFSHEILNPESSMAADIYDFKVTTIDGEETTLAAYKGKALLIVNTASRCGFTPQYQSLQTLYDKYREQGFEVLGFPANNFMGQEPGTNEEIKQFCSTKFRVKFPMFSKISVKGKDIDPLYAYLTSQPGMEGDIAWNFNKFLVGPDGKVSGRYGSTTDPLSDKLRGDLEALLPKK